MSRPLLDLTLFVDECLGHHDVPGALARAGIQVEVLRDHFAAGTEDATWLAAVGRLGWVVLTSDKRIRRRNAEMQALLAANVIAFVLTSGNLSGQAAGLAFVRAYPRMQKLVRDRVAPFVAAVTAAGSVSLLTPAPRRAGRKKSPTQDP